MRSLIALFFFATTPAWAQDFTPQVDPLPKGARVTVTAELVAEMQVSGGEDLPVEGVAALHERFLFRFKVLDEQAERVRLVLVRRSSDRSFLGQEEHDELTQRPALTLDHSGAGLRVYVDGHLALEPEQQQLGDEAWRAFAGLQSFAREQGALQVGEVVDLARDGDQLPLEDGLLSLDRIQLRLRGTQGGPRRPEGVLEVTLRGDADEVGHTMRADLHGAARLDGRTGVMTSLELAGPIELRGEDLGTAKGLASVSYHATVR